ncbi:MAG: hypothetical protein IJL89_06745 [Firmicutes bacterium]|nr:hypothetical protein [Bacillota bacterium]
MTKKESKSLAEELAMYDEKISRLQEQLDGAIQKKNEVILNSVNTVLEENGLNLQELLGLADKKKQPFTKPEKPIFNDNKNENKGDFNQ